MGLRVLIANGPVKGVSPEQLPTILRWACNTLQTALEKLPLVTAGVVEQFGRWVWHCIHACVNRGAGEVIGTLTQELSHFWRVIRLHCAATMPRAYSGAAYWINAALLQLFVVGHEQSALKRLSETYNDHADSLAFECLCQARTNNSSDKSPLSGKSEAK